MDVVNSLLNLELQVMILQKCFDHLNAKASFGDRLTQNQIDAFVAQAKADLRLRHPEMGIN